MASMRRCIECGRTYASISGTVAAGHTRTDLYCSAKCQRAAEAAKGSSSSGPIPAGSSSDIGSLMRVLKVVGIVFIALVTVVTVLCYKFPKFLKEKNKKYLYAYIITWAVLIAGTVIYFSFFSPEAVSGIKTEIVSASCETEEKFVSILNKALSGVSATVIEGEEFTTYSQQARDAVKERNSTFKDSVYFVRLPDSVNVYVWFKNADEATAYVYKTK
jgi:hypothetical protein